MKRYVASLRFEDFCQPCVHNISHLFETVWKVSMLKGGTGTLPLDQKKVVKAYTCVRACVRTCVRTCVCKGNTLTHFFILQCSSY